MIGPFNGMLYKISIGALIISLALQTVVGIIKLIYIIKEIIESSKIESSKGE